MTAHLVTISRSRGGQTLINKSDACVVWVADASGTKTADARAAAAASYGSTNEMWADADVLELTQANLAAPVRLAQV